MRLTLISLSNILQLFVKNYRNTNGRTSGRIRFWLESHIKRLYFKKEKYPESLRDKCLFELFQNCLTQQINNGKQHTCKFNLAIIIGLIPKTTVGDRTLRSWFNQDFPDTDVCPHKTDYCPDCFEYKSSIKSLQIKIDLNKVT
jgi:hypothetical protein